MEAKFREKDEREEQLVKAKEKLENDIAEMMKMSGDNSSQLTKMNDELRLKERYVCRRTGSGLPAGERAGGGCLLESGLGAAGWV